MNPQEQDQALQKPQPTQTSKISKTTFVKMLAVALFFDISLGGIQLVPIVGSIAASIFNVVPLTSFYVWYKIDGVSFSNPKKGVSFFGASLLEFVPILNALPAWTAEVIYMYVLENKEVLLNKVGGVVGKTPRSNSDSNTTIPGKTIGPLKKNPQGARFSQESIKPKPNTIKNTPSRAKIQDVRGKISQQKQQPQTEQPHNPDFIFGKSQGFQNEQQFTPFKRDNR